MTDMQFVLSPLPLNPFYGGNEYEKQWRSAVLDLLRYVPNVIVLSECAQGSESSSSVRSLPTEPAGGFTLSTLRNRVLEICSPPLSSPSRPTWWPFRSSSTSSPDISLATEETVSMWIRQNGRTLEEIDLVRVDQLLRHYPAPRAGGAQWTSVEVDTGASIGAVAGTPPRAMVVFWQGGKEVGRVEVLGRKGRAAGREGALGGVAESFGQVSWVCGLA